MHTSISFAISICIAFTASAFAEELLAPAPKPVDQIKIETRIIRGPAAVVVHGKIVAPADAKARLAEIASKKGWDVLSAPTVVTRPGQQATIEVGRELIFAPGEDAQWVGIRIELDMTETPDGAIHTKARVVLSEASGEKADSLPLLTFEQEADVPVSPGHTLSLVVPTKNPGELATFLLTPKWITPDGVEK